MKNTIELIQEQGQSVWYDNVRRGLIDSGELSKIIADGVTGLTSNPTIFEKAIAGSSDYDSQITSLINSKRSVAQIYESLVTDDIRRTADLLRPIYESTLGKDGYACLEVSPRLAHDTGGTIAEAKRLFSLLSVPNVMIKVPATPEGIPAIRELIGTGINVNVTLIFSLLTYGKVIEAYISGIEDYVASGGKPGQIASVASFFVSRVDTSVDGILQELPNSEQESVKALFGKTAVSNAKLAYRDFKSTFAQDRFSILRKSGAMPQRPLWASTSTKNPAYNDLLYVESLIGPDTVNTMPPETLSALLDHGQITHTIEEGQKEAEEHIDSLEAAGVNISTVTDELLANGVKSFSDSFETLLVELTEKMKKLN
ncbi:MAG: transaldolase / glucose-6-phosphate isomerase [Chloroflexi bacterium]|jgi:transaldolase/glucose-6-phosphate isomerase|nr:MAG: transaldolase / glucose-6-phosphate isomerase [Chloroflexota bacterium]